MQYNNFVKQLELINRLSVELADECFRIVEIDTEVYCVVSVDAQTGEFDISVCDASFMPLKLLDDLSPEALIEYAQIQKSVNIWIREESIDFPIPRNQELITKYTNFLSDPEELESELDELLKDQRFSTQ